jgi:hypothetical protein
MKDAAVYMWTVVYQGGIYVAVEQNDNTCNQCIFRQALPPGGCRGLGCIDIDITGFRADYRPITEFTI